MYKSTARLNAPTLNGEKFEIEAQDTFDGSILAQDIIYTWINLGLIEAV